MLLFFSTLISLIINLFLLIVNYFTFTNVHAAFACGQQEGKVMEEPYSRSNLMSQTDIEEEMKLAFDHTNFLNSDDKAISQKMTMGLSR